MILGMNLVGKVSGHSQLPQSSCAIGDWSSPDPVPKSESESDSKESRGVSSPSELDA